MPTRRRADETVKKDNLPYVELEYIQSSGVQYLDLGINYLFGDEQYFKFYNVSNYSYENKGYGAGTSLSVNITGGGRNDSYGHYYLCMYMLNYDRNFIPVTYYTNIMKHVVDEHWKIDTTTGQLTATMHDYTASKDWTLTGATFSTTYTSGNSIYVFRDHSSSYPYPSAKRLYSFWLKRADGNYAINLIPVKRKEDNVICVYDTISQTFFTNRGSGTFIAGPEKT